MALSNLALFGGAFFTPVLVGKIAQSLGWEWTFYFVAIFAAAVLPGVVVFCPETTFRRERRFEIDTMGNLVGERLGKEDVGRGGSGGGSGDDNGRGRVTPEKVSFKRSLLPFNGRHSDERYLNLLLRPFPLFFHPGILWVSVSFLSCFHFFLVLLLCVFTPAQPQPFPTLP